MEKDDHVVEPSFQILTLQNPQFATYLIVSALLILKMNALILLTIYHRMKNKVVISPEDAQFKEGTVVGSHPDVDRVRRAFQNDLENIPAFLVIGLLYLWVSSPDWAVHTLYYLFFLARLGHTLVYAVYVVPQPSRAICFFLGFLILEYMCCHVVVYAILKGYHGH
uniref:Microsomal glutathione S-transferase 1 n=1 Tax=Lissorhoptrus oryzophilus TaxID=308863 RepID=A0A2R4FXB9_9CUCU|nr:microsomal glutathione S-transferase 4 [Lissorhoptrus oryzophilus]